MNSYPTDDPYRPSKPSNKALVSAALRLLARRDYCRSEFTAKLHAAEFTLDEIAAAADWCHVQGFLDESRYTETTSRRLGYKYGVQRVAHTLRQKGVTEDHVAVAINTLKQSESTRASALWARRFRAVAETAEEKSKHIRYLQTRGFSFSVIKEAIAGVDVPM